MLWLPHGQPDVLAHLARVREILTRFADIVTPVAERDAHMPVGKLAPCDISGTYRLTITPAHAFISSSYTDPHDPTE